MKSLMSCENGEEKVPRSSVAYRGRAIVFYDKDTLKVTYVERHGLVGAATLSARRPGSSRRETF